MFYTWGVPNDLLARKVYAAAILVSVLGQERGLVPSEVFPKPPISLVRHLEGGYPLSRGQNDQKWPKGQLFKKM